MCIAWLCIQCQICRQPATKSELKQVIRSEKQQDHYMQLTQES